MESKINGSAKLAAVAMHSEMGNTTTNLQNIEYWATKAQQKGASFALFPEECITGSLNKSDLSSQEILEITDQAKSLSLPFLEKLSKELSITLVVGTITSENSKLKNSAYVVDPEGHLGTFSKIHLPGNEKNWFVPGDSLPILSSQGWTFAIGICFDARFPELFRTAASKGAEFFLLAVGASGMPELVSKDGDQTAQAKEHKELNMKILPSRAVDNGMYVIHTNQAGKSGDSWFPGLVLAIDPNGNLIGEHMPNEGMIIIEISRNTIEQARSSLSCTIDEIRPSVYK